MPPLNDVPSASFDPGRRAALERFVAGATALIAGCGRTRDPLVPYVDLPRGMVPGEPMLFATSLPLAGIARGVLVESHEGRPTKVHGNPLHPSSLGSTDVFAEAALLGLYDPDRSRSPSDDGRPVGWGRLEAALRDAIPADGAGVRLVTGPIASPTLARQLREACDALPALRWHVCRTTRPALELTLPAFASQAPARTPHVRRVQMLPDFSRIDLVVSVGADPLGSGPAQVAFTRGWSAARQARRDHFRSVVFESHPTLTGAHADRRHAVRPSVLAAVVRALDHALRGADEPGAGNVAKRDSAADAASRDRVDAPRDDLVRADPADAGVPRRLADAIDTCARALLAHRGRAVVLCDDRLDPPTQSLVVALNRRIDAPVDWREPCDRVDGLEPHGLDELAHAMENGDVRTLVVVDANPLYASPIAARLAAAMHAVPACFHFGTGIDETARACHWHGPLHHPLESWSDLRGVDGSCGLMQPLIAPLHDTRSVHRVFDLLTRRPGAAPLDTVRQTWRDFHARRDDASPADFDAFWRRALHDGVVPGTRSDPIDLARLTQAPATIDSRTDRDAQDPSARPRAREAAVGDAAAQQTPVEVVVAMSSTVFDGSFAGNAWLQECPEPFSKQVWGNAAWISPADGDRWSISNGDIVELALPTPDEASARPDDATLRLPALRMPGQASGSVTLFAGYGRTVAGAIGSHVGHRVGAFVPWGGGAFVLATIRGTGRRDDPLRVQRHVEQSDRDLLRTVTPAALAERSVSLRRRRAPASFFAEQPLEASTAAWAMEIDLDSCTGCNACVIACQAENNVPVVGPEEIARGRDMHWLRIDTYALDGEIGRADDEVGSGATTDGGSASESASESAPDSAPDFPPGPDAGLRGFQPVPCMHCEQAPCEPVCPVAAAVHDAEGLNLQVYNRCVGTRTCQANCPYKVRRFNFFGYADGQAYENLGAPLLQALRNPEVTVRPRGVMEKCTYCVQRISTARRQAKKEDRTIRDGEVVTACQQACPARAIRFGDLAQPTSAVSVARSDPRHYLLLEHLGTKPRTGYLAKVVEARP
ncbi:MAG: 4Fe-4S dicluster domain-containing protein [Lautropia sp.]